MKVPYYVDFTSGFIILAGLSLVHLIFLIVETPFPQLALKLADDCPKLAPDISVQIK